MLPPLSRRLVPLFFSAAAMALVAAGSVHASDDAAVAACQKHVESLLDEATATRYEGGFQVEPVDARTVSVAGRVSSRSAKGHTTDANFRCKAKRYGRLWTTSTQLIAPR